MKKSILFIFTILLLMTSLTEAQYRRIVLLEEATNASCGPCAANNPTLQAFFENNFGGVISVRYHAWWPGSDPMYNANQSGNKARINYYGISGVPNYVIDGDLKGVPGDREAMKTQMQERLAMGSPVKIDVSAQTTADSVITEIIITAGADVMQSDLKLRAAVIERMKTYNSPPGSNGEKVFPDIFRKMMTSADGEPINEIKNGDVLTYRYSTAMESDWNRYDLAVVAWLQSDDTKEVINSNINLNTYVVYSNDPPAVFLDYNQSYTKKMFIVNENESVLNLKAFPKDWTLPLAWNSSIYVDGVEKDTIEAALNPGDTLNIELNLMTAEEGKFADLKIFVQNADDIYKYGSSSSFFGTVNSGSVLFVDADGGENYETKFFEALDSAKANYTYVPKANVDALFKSADPNQFDALIWNISWSFPAMDLNSVNFLSNYLDNGGSLFIAGQDIGWDIFDGQGSSGFTEARNFYEYYLDADYVADNSNVYLMDGVEGDPLGDGLSFRLQGPYSKYPEVIDSKSGSGVLFMNYQGTDKYGAIHFDSGTFKTVYTGFGLEQISESEMRNLLVKNILNWFGVLTNVDDNGSDQLTYKYELSQNYPNPFNPATTIKYQIKNRTKVEVSVYDILGREVARLVNAVQEAGNYNVDFNAAQLSSGVYFYRLKTDEFTSIKKMMLLK